MFRSGRTVSPRGWRPRSSERKCPWRFMVRLSVCRKIGDHAFSAEVADAGVLLATRSHIDLVNCGQIINMGPHSDSEMSVARREPPYVIGSLIEKHATGPAWRASDDDCPLLTS
jgi:hypothetical protein